MRKLCRMKRWKDERTWRLTHHDVQIIRRLAQLGHFQSEIAAFFGVTQQMVSGIVLRKKWRDVPDKPDVDISKFLKREPALRANEILKLVGLGPTATVRRI